MSKNKEALRDEILRLTREYYEAQKSPTEFHEGQRLHYAGRVYDAEEMENLVASALEFWLTAGHWTESFEKGLAKYLGVPHVFFVNAGSSANLLAFMALTSPLLGARKIERGDEVITVAAGFPTTVAPIVQYGAVPVFVDVKLPAYNIDTSLLESALSSKTKAVMLAHTLGNPFDLATVKAFCDKHGLWLIEDNCDALGSRYEFNGESHLTGTIGDIGTSSFYPPHHMTTGEGGAVYTKDPLLARILRSLRDWGRDCRCPSGHDGICGHRFDRQYGELPFGYDHKYVYSHFGYNLKATDMQAAIGCAQLKKLPAFVEARKKNFAYLHHALQDMQDVFLLPEAEKHADPSWFGFALTCKKGVERHAIVTYLEAHGVQTRMLFAGNLIKHPCFDSLRQSGQGFRVVGALTETDRILQDTFWLGVYPGLTEDALAYMVKVLHEAIR